MIGFGLKTNGMLIAIPANAKYNIHSFYARMTESRIANVCAVNSRLAYGEPQRNSNRRAFTLLEMLVVIGAIAVLAAVSLGIASSAVERGRQAKCMNNLRQIGTGMLNFSSEQDNDLQLPTCYELKVQGGGKWKLFAKFQHTPSDLGRYVDATLLTCPTDKKPAPFLGTDAKNNSVTIPCSYGFNFLPGITGVRLTNLDPQTFLVFDGQCTGSAQTSHWYGDERDVPRFMSDLGAPRHDKKFNVFFADGHCEPLSTLPAGGALPP